MPVSIAHQQPLPLAPGALVLALALLACTPVNVVWAHDEGSQQFPCIEGFGVPALQFPPEEIGQWGPVEEWPIQATHTTLLSSGKVLLFHQTPPFTYLWDPIANTLEPVQSPAHNLFCAGHGILADGRVITIGGGGGLPHLAVPNTSLFDPVSETWTDASDMVFNRWYPTSTTLPDGRILATSGFQSGMPNVRANIPEVYDGQTDTWSPLPGAELELLTYPYMFVLPNGKLLNVMRRGTTTRMLDVDSQTWEIVATSNLSREQGCAAMYRPGQVMRMGGELDARAEVIDMTVASPSWRQVGMMEYPRRRCDLVLLPDGTMLAVGGSVQGQDSPECAVHSAEIWDPATEVWMTMASMERPRVYHSTALLLPDGRVLAAGGENSHPPALGERNFEVYSPPYLFKGLRPQVDSAPGSIRYGDVFRVDTPDSMTIKSVALMRPGSVTHNYDQSQSYVPLIFDPQATYLHVTAPENANLAPPGPYMLFAVNIDGVPSAARFVLLESGCGNGVYQAPLGEECDDGNNEGGDGCSPDCHAELDHFMSYRVKPSAGSGKFAELGPVWLTGEFVGANYEIRKPRNLLFPVDESREGVNDATTLLEEYRIRSRSGFTEIRDVQVVNECNDLLVRLSRPDSLLVPTGIDPNLPPPAPMAYDHSVDPMLCYRARVQRKLQDGTRLPKFPKGIQVEVEDEFQIRRYDLRKLTKLCIPTEIVEDPEKPTFLLWGPSRATRKLIEPAEIRNQHTYLLCYRAELAKRFVPQNGCGPADPSDRGSTLDAPQSAHPGRRGIYTNNQFGPGQMDTFMQRELCLPSAVFVQDGP